MKFTTQFSWHASVEGSPMSCPSWRKTIKPEGLRAGQSRYFWWWQCYQQLGEGEVTFTVYSFDGGKKPSWNVDIFLGWAAGFLVKILRHFAAGILRLGSYFFLSLVHDIRSVIRTDGIGIVFISQRVLKRVSPVTSKFQLVVPEITSSILWQSNHHHCCLYSRGVHRANEKRPREGRGGPREKNDDFTVAICLHFCTGHGHDGRIDRLTRQTH